MSTSVTEKLSLRALVALVMGSMIGSGMFALPSAFATTTGALGAIIAWSIAGAGMLMLAFVFQNLSQRRPDLDSGIYAYAHAGFGNYMGFCSAMGYWIGCCLADVACLILIKATLGVFFPVFGDGTTPVALIGATCLIWGVHFLILRGVKEAAMINTIATVAKIVPIFIFIIVVIACFDKDIFALNFWGNILPSTLHPDITNLDAYGYIGSATEHAVDEVLAPALAMEPESLFSQVRHTMLITVFVFVGIEGASVYSRYAKNRKDVGLATVLGFLGVLCLLILVTVPAYGIMSRADMSALPTPSMAAVFEHLVGRWGAVFIGVGLLISILGNYLSWSLLAAEVLFSAANDKAMPAFLARQNPQKVPVAALLVSNIVIQAFLLLTPFAEYAFHLALKMTSSMTLVPYLLVAAYGAKLAITGATYEADAASRKGDMVKGLLATIYAAVMLYAGGIELLLLSAALYCAGSVLFFIARREQRQTLFTTAEALIFGCITIAAIFAVHGLIAGTISI